MIKRMEELKWKEIRLVAIDLDGTMLNNDKKLTEHTKEVLVRAGKEGILIVPATGRHHNGIPKEVAELEGVRYFLTTNGAAVYDKKEDRYLYEDAMPCTFALQILESLMQYDILVDAFIGGNAYRSDADMDYVTYLQIPDVVKEFIRNSRKGVPSLYDYIKENHLDVYKYTLNFKPDGQGGYLNRDQVLKMAESEKRLSCVCGGLNNLELTNHTATKGNALMQLGELLGIKKEQIMAIGDSGNDYTMLKAAGIGVAMENAEPLVLEAADFVTKSNEENGVAYVIERYLLNL